MHSAGWLRAEIPLILGDSGPLGHVADEWQFPFTDKSTMDLAVLPVSSDFLLVGYQATLPCLDFEEINRVQAAFSWDFFVSSEDTDRERRYWASLGSNAKNTDAVIESFIDGAEEGFARKVDEQLAQRADKEKPQPFVRKQPKIGPNEPCHC